jgi:hypothetical protein
MLNFLKQKKAQSLIEYILVLAAVIVAILFMQLYVNRAISGRLKDASDQIGDQYSSSAKFNITTTRGSKITESTTAAGGSTTKYDKDESTRSGSESLQTSKNEFFKF